MSYESVTLDTVAYARNVVTDDSAKLVSANSTFEVPETLELKRTLPTAGQSLPVVRGSIKLAHSWKDSVTSKVYTAYFEVKSSCPVQIPAATLAVALNRVQAAIANEGLATDVLTKGIVY